MLQVLLGLEQGIIQIKALAFEEITFQWRKLNDEQTVKRYSRMWYVLWRKIEQEREIRCAGGHRMPFSPLVKSNLLGWHGLIKLHRFQGYSSTIRHLYIALCVHHPKSSLLPSPLTSPFTFFYLPHPLPSANHCAVLKRVVRKGLPIRWHLRSEGGDGEPAIWEERLLRKRASWVEDE